ncbi:MAG: CHASE2 domain-containing protein [Gammaproteobacteria bacterium]|nr:CHASE2 domain-containing protein [Gammaproteobacteria bacterium]
MKKIFISYRRRESSGYSRLVYERLRAALPAWEIFMDVEEIPVGENWRGVLETRIDSADVMIVLIGREWLTMTGPDGMRRLDHPDDVTRWEIASALEKKKRLLPVLLEDLPPLAADALPEALSPLAEMQSVRIRHETFNADLENLIARLTGRGLRELLRREQGLRLLERTGRWSIPAITVLTFVLLWVGLLDLFALDTRTATWSLALADTLFPSTLDAELSLVAIPSRFDRRAASARATYAELVARLTAAGADAILLDLFFQDPRAGDGAFSAALKQAAEAGTNVFFGFTELEENRPRAVKLLAESAAGLGLVCVGRRLGYALMMPIAMNYRKSDSAHAQESIGSLPGIALLGAAGQVSVDALDPASMALTLTAKDGGKLRYPISMLDPVRQVQKGCKALRQDTHTALILLRLSPLTALRGKQSHLEMDAVLAGRFDAEKIRGRTVIVGVEAPEEEFTVAYGLGPEQRYGYELHADAINTLKTNRVVQPMRAYPQLFLLLAVSGAGAWLGIKLYHRPAWFRRLTLTLLMFLYLLVSVYLVAGENLLLHLSYDLFALVVAYLMFRRFSSKWLIGNDARPPR